MRVIISGALPPPMGGVGAYFQTLLNSSLSNRVEMLFVQTSSQDRELSSTGKFTFINIISAIQDIWRFTKACIKFHPQLAHISTAVGLSFVKNSVLVIIARLLGCQVLLHPHCSIIALYHHQSKLKQWYFRQIIKLTNGVIVLSKEWLDLKNIIPGREVYYLPNAINLNQFREIAHGHISGQKPNQICKVLYLGYIGKSKGSFDIVDAAMKVRSQGMDMQFDLVGGALSPAELEQLHEKIKSSHMDGYVRINPLSFGKEKLRFLDEADIFIYPSYQEGLPMAVLEALACGIPIIATSVGGLPDLIQDGITGYLIPPGKPDIIASHLIKLANNPELRSAMGESGYQEVCDKYDIEQHVQKLVEIYHLASPN
jgi:glycosyltransferase involved in cell wall biosynthesis